MQFLSPTKSEEIAAVPAFFSDLFTFEVLGEKKKKSGFPIDSGSDNTKGK